MDIETKLDMLAEAALAPCVREVDKKLVIRYRNEMLKEIRRLQECERKLAEVAAL